MCIRDRDTTIVLPIVNSYIYLVGKITLEELTETPEQMKNRKATGQDGVHTEIIKGVGLLLNLHLWHFINACWTTKQFQIFGE